MDESARQEVIVAWPVDERRRLRKAERADLHLRKGESGLPQLIELGKISAGLDDVYLGVCTDILQAELVNLASRDRPWERAKLGKATWVDWGEVAHTGSASPQYLIPLGFLGFVLCLVRWVTRSLYPCMALHAMNNSLALGINQLHRTGGEILALIAGSFALIGAITLPLSARTAAIT